MVTNILGLKSVNRSSVINFSAISMPISLLRILVCLREQMTVASFQANVFGRYLVLLIQFGYSLI